MIFEGMSLFGLFEWAPSRIFRVWPSKLVTGLGVTPLSERKQHHQGDYAHVDQRTFPLRRIEFACRSAAVFFLSRPILRAYLVESSDPTRHSRPHAPTSTSTSTSRTPTPSFNPVSQTSNLPIQSPDLNSRLPILRGPLLDATMSLKREADPFIKPDPDAKRVKTEGGDGNFSLYSIPMAPPPAVSASSTSSAIAPKIEGGDRKPLGPVSDSHHATLRCLSPESALACGCHFSLVKHFCPSG